MLWVEQQDSHIRGNKNVNQKRN